MFARDVGAGQTRNWTLKAALSNEVRVKIKLHRKIQTPEKQADKKNRAESGRKQFDLQGLETRGADEGDG